MRSWQLIGLSSHDDQHPRDDARCIPLRVPFVENGEALDTVPFLTSLPSWTSLDSLTAAWT